MTAAEAIELIHSGDTVATSGFIGMGHPEELSQAVEAKFLATGAPSGLTLAFGASQSNPTRNDGLNRWCKEGLLKRVFAAHFNLQKDLAQLINDEKVEAYAYPQGVMMHLFRAIGGRKPGVITEIGLKTFVDPRETGGRLNSRSTESMIDLIRLADKEYLWYKAFPVNVALIRGTCADERGNVTCEKEAIRLEFLALALAAKASGGKVIVQVESLAQAGTLDPRRVIVPGVLVDAIVVASPENHWQSHLAPYNPSYTGDVRVPTAGFKPIPLDERKVICRRAAMELVPGAVINLGIGMPEGVSAVAAEEGIIDMLTATVEPGLIGGIPVGGLGFGCSVNPEAMLDHPSQFDFYDGGGLDLACLGMAELDRYGNVNVSKFGPRIAGAGGFINISQSSKKVVFCGTFTASGFKAEIGDGKLKIVAEGKSRKLIEKVGHVTFSGEFARERGMRVLYVTERAVFEMRPEGLTLTEVAPGVKVQSDIVDHMGFKPHIASDLKLMDERIFYDRPMGIREDLTNPR